MVLVGLNRHMYIRNWRSWRGLEGFELTESVRCNASTVRCGRNALRTTTFRTSNGVFDIVVSCVFFAVAKDQLQLNFVPLFGIDMIVTYCLRGACHNFALVLRYIPSTPRGSP